MKTGIQLIQDEIHICKMYICNYEVDLNNWIKSRPKLKIAQLKKEMKSVNCYT